MDNVDELIVDVEAEAEDDVCRKAAIGLLERYIVSQSKHPDLHHIIRMHFDELQVFFTRTAGYQLLPRRDSDFYKLEKIPIHAERPMGLSGLQTPLDYVFFCACMAFISQKWVGEQFIFSEVIEKIPFFMPKGELPGIEKLTWLDRDQRSSLSRAMITILKLGIVSERSGDRTIDFVDRADIAVLYDVHPVMSYIMRRFERPLGDFQGPEEFLHYETKVRGQYLSPEQRLGRALFLSPSVLENELLPSDFEFFYSDNAPTFKRTIEKNTGYYIENIHGMQSLVYPRRVFSGMNLLGGRESAQSKMVFIFASIVKASVDTDPSLIGPDNRVTIPYHDFKDWVSTMWGRYHRTFTKKDQASWRRETLVDEFLQSLVNWKLALYDKDRNIVQLLPTLVRMTGRFEFEYKGDDDDGSLDSEQDTLL